MKSIWVPWGPGGDIYQDWTTGLVVQFSFGNKQANDMCLK